MLHYITFVRNCRLFWLSCITGTFKNGLFYMFTGYMYNRGYKLYLFICDLAQNPYKQLINSSISLTIFAKTWIQFLTVFFRLDGWDICNVGVAFVIAFKLSVNCKIIYFILWWSRRCKHNIQAVCINLTWCYLWKRELVDYVS